MLEEAAKAPKKIAKHTEKDFVEIVVKRGDVLERIAKANGTTVSAIKKANNLQTERLSVGQVLRVPVGSKKNQNQDSPVNTVKKEATAQSVSEYYTIKSGDNPWKVAKQFQVNFEDLLLLNNLDEETARNMKVGDRIRVK